MIVVFDGVCNLCNGTVQFILKRDRTGAVRFASVQSPAGQALLSRHGYAANELDTLLVIDADALHIKTEAVRRILAQLGGVWAWLAKGLRWIPVSVRDWFYTRVALNRYALFGRRATCAVPCAAQMSRFLVSEQDVR